jgi:trk system potassium uptake protein TrkH
MIFAPGQREYFSLFNITGKILTVLGFLLLIPAMVAWYFRELNPLYDFLISFCVVEATGVFLLLLFPLREELNYSLGFLMVAALWLIIPLFSALPLYLSGHFGCYLDAFFEAISGFTTSGLSLMRDIDHAPVSINFWRHFTMFLGGQGIILVVLSFLGGAASFGMELYMGEAREEKIMPNIMATARFIWVVSIVYLLLGTGALFIALRQAGFGVADALMHGVNLFMVAFDTGGFTPQSMNIYYYHSLALEVVIVVLMMLGMINFSLHYFLWLKHKKEIRKNIEIRAFMVTFSVLFIVLGFSILNTDMFQIVAVFFRKTFFQLISAHSGTGFANVSVSELSTWPQLGLLVLIVAMGLGGSVGSTTGGIKLMRIALLFKAIGWEIQKMVIPQRVWVLQKYHHLNTRLLDDSKIRIIFIMSLLYAFSYFAGGVVGMFYGNSFFESLFESTSAASNAGLSIGITSPDMPTGLKIMYMVQMWTGRLEFLSIIVGVGLVWSSFKRWRRIRHSVARGLH